MIILEGLIFFCFGTIIASFLNLCVFRLEKEALFSGIISGRSVCDNCQKVLSWYELVPIFSYLFLRGKCSSCKGNIKSFNLFSEFFLGLTVLSFWIASVPVFYYLPLFVLYFFAVYDFFYKGIPKQITDILLIISLCYWLYNVLSNYTLELLYPILFVLCFSLIIFLASFKKTIFGFGDIAVFVLLAFWFKAGLFFYIILLSFACGGIFSLFLVIKNRKNLKKYIPFLPFVLFGFIFAVWFDYVGIVW